MGLCPCTGTPCFAVQGSAGAATAWHISLTELWTDCCCWGRAKQHRNYCTTSKAVQHDCCIDLLPVHLPRTAPLCGCLALLTLAQPLLWLAAQHPVSHPHCCLRNRLVFSFCPASETRVFCRVVFVWIASSAQTLLLTSVQSWVAGGWMAAA